MTSEEKQVIFNLVKTASSWNYGYTSPDFDESSFPKFEDDFVEIVNTQKFSKEKSQILAKSETFSQNPQVFENKSQTSEENPQTFENKAQLNEQKSQISSENLQNQENQNFKQTNNSWQNQSQEKLKEILSKAMKSQVEQNVPLEKTESSFQNQQSSENKVQISAENQQNISAKSETSSQNQQNQNPKNAQDLLEIQNIAKKISECQNCILSKTRKNTVPGEGVQNPLVMVIGEGPGEEEDLSGRPFVGKAGQLLDKMLAAISLDRKLNCYIANIVKCRPPRNRTPMIDEAQACKGFLVAQIHVLKPKYILAMGRTAVQNLMETSDGINALRGKWFSCNGIPLMATYHPSALLHDVSLKAPAWQDLKFFRKKLIDEYPKYEEEFKTFKASFLKN